MNEKNNLVDLSAADTTKVISHFALADEFLTLEGFFSYINFSEQEEKKIASKAEKYIGVIRGSKTSSVESFIQKYNLSNQEGVAVMCLAEALLRIPDSATAGELVEDKLKHKNWSEYTGNSKSFLVNAGSWGLALTGKIVDMSESSFSLSRFFSRVSEPVILTALKQAIKFISNEFIIGVDINEAIKQSKEYEKKGFGISFDILGESSRTSKQADFYFNQYLKAVDDVKELVKEGAYISKQPNISVKMTALYPRVELAKREMVFEYLIPRLEQIISKCRANNISISFDAEEANRLDIYLEVLDRLLANQKNNSYNGIGVVIQAYQKRAFYVIDHIVSLAKKYNKIVPVRLVKGAYWDSEIKKAQELGLEGYPVFTHKEFTDVSYLACAKKILSYDNYLYPQFATHNAYTVAAIQHMAGGKNFEFQKLQGMGNILHGEVVKEGFFSRIYAPVGKYEDLLAYLMRRLLENGANTSFVNLIGDESLSIEDLAQNPIKKALSIVKMKRKSIPLPADIFSDERKNSKGFDIGYIKHYSELKQKKQDQDQYVVASLTQAREIEAERMKPILSPIDNSIVLGEVKFASKERLSKMVSLSKDGFNEWSKVDVNKRASILEKIADTFEQECEKLIHYLMVEGGKNIQDSIAEVREAVDFARYYANAARKLFAEVELPSCTGEKNILSLHPKGTFVCISPWNFPLAIFAGQIFAALVAGNSVIAKAAEATSIIAHFATSLMHKAGVPRNALQLAVASGREVSETIIADDTTAGVCFTGSNETALSINRILAARNSAIAPLIAETGGQNAMIIDSSALPEQACDNIINSAFGSIGQRCSALRVAYIQEEIYDKMLELIIGAMNQLEIGDPRDFKNDLGPVINNAAKKELEEHIMLMAAKGFRIIKHERKFTLLHGSYFVPHLIEINHISDIKNEVFGPVLHLRKFKASELNEVIEEINSTGFGLTFGIQTRIEERIHSVSSAVNAGNIYANRTTIGAQVGCQPFGGEGRSGTGFKAGGPYYLLRFCSERVLDDSRLKSNEIVRIDIPSFIGSQEVKRFPR